MAEELLPEPLPSNPLPLFAKWLSEARDRRVQPNPDAMALATVDAQCRPSARVVLCKRFSVEDGFVVFFTNFNSRKGRDLVQHPRAAAVFHWDALHRQVRIEGPVLKSPDSESNEYFASRPLHSRIGAWASEQSEPLPSRAALLEQVRAAAAKFNVASDADQGHVPRPPQWGGHRLWIESIELWSEGDSRIHDRALWTRALIASEAGGFTAGEWRATRLNP
ncbi:MAG TPA: pyridoxamine 5'-phosphate oxidase [Steroidobacter sp.]|nr:pyridoxamine 5'-phosphate oxidase [Steroidobacter sp.]